ncbi:MAG: polysaccharide biosynthesis C-terminal domain-containing protein [Lentisphaerae bacterium]|nr:polysaccharide biosynthesis C-terminal domain-containing protein [Lentisphaerota bacterium]
MAESSPRPVRTRVLMRGAFLLFLARLGTMVLGLLQVMLLAAKFGAGAVTDAFFTAQAISFLLVGAVESGLSLAFVPAFVHKLEHEGADAAWMLAAGLFRAGFWIVLIFAVCCSALAPWLPHWLAPGFSPEACAFTSEMIRMLAPVVVLMFAGAFLATLDIINERYVLLALATLVHAAAGPIALYVFAGRLGICALIAGLYVGGLLRCVLLVVALPETRRLFGPALSLRDPAMRQLGRMLGLRLLTAWFMEFNLIVARWFASLLGEGYVSCLAYASRAVMTMVRVVLQPVSRVLMPAFSRLAAHRNHDRMQRMLEQVGIAIGFVVIPLVVFLVGFRHEILTVLFKRGEFAGQSVELTAIAVLYYSVGVIAFIITPLLNGAFFAMQDSRTPFRIGAVMVLVNTVNNALLMPLLGHGGIALAASLASNIQAVLLWRSLGRVFGGLRAMQVLLSLLRSVTSAGLALAASKVAATLMGHTHATDVHPLRLVVALILGAIVYVLLQAVWNREALRRFLDLARRRRGGVAAAE